MPARRAGCFRLELCRFFHGIYHPAIWHGREIPHEGHQTYLKGKITEHIELNETFSYIFHCHVCQRDRVFFHVNGGEHPKIPEGGPRCHIAIFPNGISWLGGLPIYWDTGLHNIGDYGRGTGLWKKLNKWRMSVDDQGWTRSSSGRAHWYFQSETLGGFFGSICRVRERNETGEDHAKHHR